MFIAALFTIAKAWKQLTCSSTDEWKKKIWYKYTVEYYSAIKMNDLMPFAATWMNLDIIRQSEVSQRTNIWYHLYAKYWKNDTNEPIYETETDSQT